MKAKLIQIALGALGAAIASILQQLSAGAIDPAVTVASGATVNAVAGNVVARMFG